MMERMSSAIRALTIDAVSRANSGHPGMPLGMADFATVLFTKFLKFNPHDPCWLDRDRFVLSAGHGSMLLYSLLYLTGYPEYTLQELKNFRQLHSRTPGHPEYRIAKGIENTSGPLGQGLAMGIGMALAEARANSYFGDIIDHRTYIIAGDGCLMEGISHEAASFAGHMKLHKIILIFDDNGISIDGSTSLCTSDDQLKRFESYGWHIQQVDGHDFASIETAIANAKLSDKPSLIAAKTVIGKFMQQEGTEKTHSGGLTQEERIAFRKKLNYPPEEFYIPEDILEKWRSLGSFDQYRQWHSRYKNLSEEISLELKKAFITSGISHTSFHFETPTNLHSPEGKNTASHTNAQEEKHNNISSDIKIPRQINEQSCASQTNPDCNIATLQNDSYIKLKSQQMNEYAKAFNELRALSPNIKSEATRQSSGRVIKHLTGKFPEIVGGSCDLTGSNNTAPESFMPINSKNYGGNYIYYGVREHFMGACMNGMSLHGGVIPYGGTFFIFSDYLRPAIRMSALMGVQVIYVMTHDSIGVGEDGPTHQPIEQLDSLNLIPNMYVFRPCDYIEVLESWETALRITDAPSIIVLSRQKVNFIERELPKENMSSKGAYVIKRASQKAKLSLISSGSEISICATVQSELEKLGYPTELISVPCMSLLRKTIGTNKEDQLIESGSIAIGVEAGSGLMIKAAFGLSADSMLNIEEFGISAPYEKIYEYFGLTVNTILERCIKKLSAR